MSCHVVKKDFQFDLSVNLDLSFGHYPNKALFQRSSIWFCFTSPKSNKISDWNHIECNPWINFTPVLSGAQWQPEATLGEVRPFTIIGFPYHKLSQEECRWARLFNRGWCTLSTHKVLPKGEISLRNFPQSHHRKGYHNYHIYSRVNKKPQKFIFEYWAFSQKSYLNGGCFEEIHICIPKILYLHTS